MNERTTRDATAHGAQVAADWHGGVKSLIRACVGVNNGVRAYGNDKALFAAFLAPLIARGVLTADEARQGRSGSKLSMLNQIGEHAAMLLHPDIAPRLIMGYPAVYQAVVVFKKLPGADDAQRIRELARILENCPDDHAREYLSAELGA